MCLNCEKMEETIARYRRLEQMVSDQQVQEAARSLVLEFEAKMAALHRGEPQQT